MIWSGKFTTTGMGVIMNIMLLDSRNREVGIYPHHLAELLERQPRSDSGIEELERLHRERSRLLCKCGRVLHVVQREFPFLRRNPGQSVQGQECGLCMGAREYGAQIKGPGEARCLSGIGFVLATRTHLNEQPAEQGNAPESSGRRTTFKYARGFSILFTLIDQAGFTSLSTTLPWREMWGRIYDQLKSTPLHPRSDRSFADFAWMPGGFYQGGLRDLNNRMLEDWNHPDIQPEGWVFSMIPEMPNPSEIPIYSKSMAKRRSAEQNGETVYPPYRIEVPPYCIAPVGLSGPFLAFAIGSAMDEGDPKFRKPHFHRLLLHVPISNKWQTFNQ